MSDKKVKYAQTPETQCMDLEKGEQCPCEREEGSDYCLRHKRRGGSVRDISPVTREKYNFDRTKHFVSQFADRVNEFAVSPELSLLRAEQGILQTTLERLINALSADEELITCLGEIRALIAEIRTLRDSNVKLEKELDLLLDRETANKVAARLIDTVITQIYDTQRTIDSQNATLVLQLRDAGLTDEQLDKLTLPSVDAQRLIEVLADTYREAVEAKSDVSD